MSIINDNMDTMNSYTDTAYYGDIDSKDRDLLVKLICKEQMRMIKKDNKSYGSDKYKRLEALKVMIKDWSV